MGRLTRAESRVRTRERVVAAAAEVFAQKGFHGASLEEIAEAAGFSRGAVYSNFDDKTALFLAVRDERVLRRRRQVGDLLGDATTPAEFFEALRNLNLLESRDDVQKWFMMQLEVWLYGMRNPDVRPLLAERERAERADLASAVTALYARLDVQPPLPADELAIIAVALDRGLLYQEFLDPAAVPADFIIRALQFLLDAGVALARADPSPLGGPRGESP